MTPQPNQRTVHDELTGLIAYQVEKTRNAEAQIAQLQAILSATQLALKQAQAEVARLKPFEPETLTKADAAADLAGQPRPVAEKVED